MDGVEDQVVAIPMARKSMARKLKSSHLHRISGKAPGQSKLQINILDFLSFSIRERLCVFGGQTNTKSRMCKIKSDISDHDSTPQYFLTNNISNLDSNNNNNNNIKRSSKKKKTH